MYIYIYIYVFISPDAPGPRATAVAGPRVREAAIGEVAPELLFVYRCVIVNNVLDISLVIIHRCVLYRSGAPICVFNKQEKLIVYSNY